MKRVFTVFWNRLPSRPVLSEQRTVMSRIEASRRFTKTMKEALTVYNLGLQTE